MAKEILYVNLNYVHHGLSPKTRINTMIMGTVVFGCGIWGVIEQTTTPALVSGIVNILVGGLAFCFAQRKLPIFAKKFIRLSESSIKFRNKWFWPRRKFKWEDIDSIEMTRDRIKILTDYSSKPRYFELVSVSYEDYDALHKAIVDKCLELDIDLI